VAQRGVKATGTGFEATVSADVRNVSDVSHEARFERLDLEPGPDTPVRYEQWTIRSDEPPFIGGKGADPTPMHYFVAGIGL
jgi:hypothetical protein